MDKKDETTLKIYTTNSSEFDIKDLSPGITYKYSITARNQFAESHPFISFKTTLLPNILDAEIRNVTCASFQVNWKPVPGAIDYMVQLRVKGGQILFLTSIFKNEIALRYGSVESGVEYEITIIGKNEKTETSALSLTKWTMLEPISGKFIIFVEIF